MAIVQKLPNKINLAFPCSPIVGQGDQFIFNGDDIFKIIYKRKRKVN